MGVIVEAGIVKEGTPICVPSKEVSLDFIFLFLFNEIFGAWDDSIEICYFNSFTGLNSLRCYGQDWSNMKIKNVDIKISQSFLKIPEIFQISLPKSSNNVG